MTKEQESRVRFISKFLRTVFIEDLNACVTILDAEANLLSNNKMKGSISTLYQALEAINRQCSKMMTELKDITEND